MKKLTAAVVRETSKRILYLMVLIWIAGGIYGIVYESIRLAITPETASLDALYAYMGIPMSTGVVAYLIKSAAENKEKIKQNYIPGYGSEIEVEEVKANERTGI